MVYRKRTFRRTFKSRVLKRRKPVYRKRTYRKRRPIFAREANSLVHPPRNLKTRLVSNTNFDIAPAATSVAYNFLCCSGSDPFGANSTNQPKCWDRLCQLYQYYRIDYAKYRFCITNETTNAIMIVGWVDNNSSSTASSLDEARQMEGNRQLLLTEAGGSKTFGYITLFASIRRLQSHAETLNNWEATDEAGVNGESTGNVHAHLYIVSQKSSNAANITGVARVSCYQNARFTGIEDIAVDTTAD